MICQRAREVFPEMLDPRAPLTAASEARAHLASCPECQREFAALSRTAEALDALPEPQPSPRLRTNFHALLEAEKHAAKTPAATHSAESPRRAASWRWILSPVAGCALIALGFLAGQRTLPSRPATATAESSAPVQAQDHDTKRELVALREQIDQQRQQLEKMTTLVGYSILQQQQNPANERLRDVLTAARSEMVNDKVLDDLIQALTLDPNANVRLRALEALYPHTERATVRAGVLAALPREQNPLVQLELIDFVATAHEDEAAPFLERISSDESTNSVLRVAARMALAQF
jgi:hypothetical protein